MFVYARMYFQLQHLESLSLSLFQYSDWRFYSYFVHILTRCTNSQQLPSHEVAVRVVHAEIGTVTEHDVDMADSAGAHIYTFNCKEPTVSVLCAVYTRLRWSLSLRRKIVGGRILACQENKNLNSF